MYWVSVALAGGISVVVLIMAVLYRRNKRVRSGFLRIVCDEFGCSFHGDSFRGRFRSRAIRGDLVDALPRGRGAAAVRKFDGVLTSVATGASLGAKSIASALGASTSGVQVLRLRLELCAQGHPNPDGAKAVAAVRKELKNRVGDQALYEATTIAGTEIAVLLRGDAADPGLAKRIVELAIEASEASEAVAS